MKTSNLTAGNLKQYWTWMGRHLSPRYGLVILVADTLFRQLSSDHNIDVQSVFSWAPCAPKVARKCESKHWYTCGADGRAAGGVRSRDYQFFWYR